MWLIDSKDIVGLGIVIVCRRIRGRSSVLRGRSGRLGRVTGNGSGRGGWSEEGELVVDIEVRWSARVLVLLLLLLLLLRIVESAEGVLGLAGIAEGISEEGASSVDRVWVKGSGGRVSLKMAEGLLLVVMVVGLLGPGGEGRAAVEIEALLADFWVGRVVDEGHDERCRRRCRRWRQGRRRRGRIQDCTSEFVWTSGKRQGKVRQGKRREVNVMFVVFVMMLRWAGSVS